MTACICRGISSLEGDDNSEDVTDEGSENNREDAESDEDEVGGAGREDDDDSESSENFFIQAHPNPDRVLRKTLGLFFEKLWPDLHRWEFHVFEQTPELFKKLQSLRESPRKN